MFLPRLLPTLLCLALAGGSGYGFAAQPSRKIAAFKPKSSFAIDGNLSKPVWKDAPKATAFTDFVTGAVVQDQTTVELLYDDQFIYVGFDCQDTQPSTITARETVRDSKFVNAANGPTNTEDNIEVVLDPFSTHNNGDVSRFSVNAIGTRSAAIAGGRGSKAEWKGDWDAVTKRTPTGWVCEMRIPWNSFHYPTSAKLANLGINFTRYINRTKVLQEWSSTGPQGFLDREGIWEGVELPKQQFHRKLSLLPYILGGIGGSQGPTGKIGIDSRYTLTPQLTAVGTYNPDYSNIEGSVESIAFSHAAHSVQETRPFFTEGGNDFNDYISGNDIGTLFYSPSIAKFDAGAKVYGKIDPNDTVGILDTITPDQRNDFVTRYLHTFTSTASGGAMIVQSSIPGDSNTVAAVDGHMRFGKLQLESDIEGSEGPGAGGGAQEFSLNYQDKKLFSLYQFASVSNNYLTPDGYFPYIGYKGFNAIEDFNNTWRKGFWRGAEFTVFGLWWNQFDNSPYYHGATVDYNMTTKDDLNLDVNYNRFDFQKVPDNYVNFQFTQGVTNRFRQFGLQFQTGIEGGAKITEFGPTASLRLLKKLDLSYTGFIQNRLGVIQQHILTANYELSPTRAFGGRVVVQNADTNVYLFYHNSGGKGTDYYLLFGDPNALRTQNLFQVKVVFSF